MSEKTLLIDGLRLEYSGLFDINDLFKVIDSVIIERGYMKKEKRHDIEVKPEGKDISIEIRPVKQFERDFWGMIKLRIKMFNVRDAVLEKEGFRRKLQTGNILILFDGWTTTNLEHAWETAPVFVFLRLVYDRFINMTYFGKHQGEIIDDVRYLRKRILAHLNLYKR